MNLKLSDNFFLGLAYSVETENQSPNNFRETDHLISYKLVPLKSNSIREKRQVTSVTTHPEEADDKVSKSASLGNKKPIVSETKVWANLTRDPTLIPSNTAKNDIKPTPAKSGGRLLGNPDQIFTNPGPPPSENTTGTNSTNDSKEVPMSPLEYDMHYPEFPPEPNNTVLNNNVTVDRIQVKFY